jgi:pimeloyl-ACP methyl ester carboxylesterase
MKVNYKVIYIYIILKFIIISAWSQQVYFNFLAPEHANPNIAKGGSMHYYVRPSVKSSLTPRLLLVLPGTKGKPRNFMRFCDMAAGMGYHVLALSYDNAHNIRKLCQQSKDADCYLHIRQEIVLGNDASDLISVSADASIEQRLRDALIYLSTQDAYGQWSQFLKGTQIQWASLTVAGHSQGAGHAALLGKRYALQRVILIAGPNDYHTETAGPADWLSSKSATPANRWYVWLHAYDSSIPVVEQIEQADALGVLPVTVNFPAQSDILAGTHRILSVMDKGSPYTHLSLVVDAYTPVDDAHQPLYAPVWKYLLKIEP